MDKVGAMRARRAWRVHAVHAARHGT